MSLSIKSKPSIFSFAGNDIVYKILTTTRFSNVGIPANMYIYVVDPGPNPDDTLSLSFMTYTLDFVFKNTPDESGLQLPTNQAGNSLSVYTENLRKALDSNYLLNRYYDITYVEEGTIQLQSCDNDEIYTLSATHSLNNVSVDITSSSVTKTERDNYKIMIRPVMDSEDLGEERISVYEDEDEDQIGKIGISDYYKQIETSFPFPGETGTVVYASDNLKKGWIKYAEVYNNLVKKILTTEDDDFFYVLPGGLDIRKLGENNEEQLSTFDYLRSRQDFLTHQPLRKYVLRNQHETLSYLILDPDITTIYVMIKATWENGNTATNSFDSFQAGFMQLKDFDLTFFRLELENWDPTGAEGEPIKFEFWLQDQNDLILTTPRTHIIADETIYDHQFIFRNSFGRYDTVRMTGKGSRESEIERDLVNHFNDDADIETLQFQQKHSNSIEQQSLKVNTGFLSKVSMQPEVYRDYLREFAKSKEIYEILNGNLYPSLVTSSSLVSQKDGENLQYVEFELIRAYTDEHYVRDSKLIPDQFFNPEFNYRFVQ